MSFWCLQISQKNNKFFPGFLPYPLKRGQIKKISALYTANWRILFWLSYTTFWFDLFLEARAEILEKISLVFWEIWRHQKDILKSTDLYYINPRILLKRRIYCRADFNAVATVFQKFRRFFFNWWGERKYLHLFSYLTFLSTKKVLWPN